MLAGYDGPGGIYFDNARMAQTLGTIALAYILFAGGQDRCRCGTPGGEAGGGSGHVRGFFDRPLSPASASITCQGHSWMESLLIGK